MVVVIGEVSINVAAEPEELASADEVAVVGEQTAEDAVERVSHEQ
jgi:hypothetical protein